MIEMPFIFNHLCAHGDDKDQRYQMNSSLFQFFNWVQLIKESVIEVGGCLCLWAKTDGCESSRANIVSSLQERLCSTWISFLRHQTHYMLKHKTLSNNVSRSLEFTTKGKRRNKKNNRIPFRGQRVKCEVVWKQSIITEALLGESPWCHWLWFATRTSLCAKQSVLIHAQSSKQQLIIPSNNFPFDNAIQQAYLMLLS